MSNYQLLVEDGADIERFPDFFGIRRFQLLLYEIAQKCMYRIYTIRNNDGTIFVHIPRTLWCAAIKFFQFFFVDSHTLAVSEWKCKKKYIYTRYIFLEKNI